VATLADVDGEVTFRLGKQESNSEKPELAQVFDGSIETPGRKLAIVTAQFESVLQTEVPASVTHVTISVDDTHSPSVVCVNVV
jgi:hypothetical protein